MSWRRVIAVSAVVATVVVAAAGLPRLRVDNRLERWVGDDAVEAANYAAFRGDFGSDEFLLVAYTGGVFDPAALDLQLEALETIEGLPGVVSVRGVPQVWRDLFGGEDPEALTHEITSSPFFARLLISDDGRTAGLLVEVDSGEDPAARRELVGGVRRAMTPLGDAGFQVDLVGSTALAVALDDASVEEARKGFAIALAGSLLVLVLLLRSWRAMAAVATCAGVTVVLTLGGVAWVDLPLDMITSALPPLLWVLALGNAVHVVRRYQLAARDRVGEDPLAHALAETRRACVLASVTTAAGFASLLVAPMRPVRELGAIAAVGLLVGLAITLGLLPTVIRWMRIPLAAPEAGRSGLRWGGSALTHPRTVVVIVVGFGLLAVATLPMIRVASDPLSFLPPDHETVAAYRHVGGRVAGFYSLEVVLEPPGAWDDPANMAEIDRVSRVVESSPMVSRAISGLDVLRQLRRWDRGFGEGSYGLPESRDEADRLIDGAGDFGHGVLQSLISPNGRRVRISGLVDEMGEQRFLELVQEVRATLGSLPPGWSGFVTGQVLGLVEAQQRLVRTQVLSLVLAFGLVFAVLGLGLGSVRLMLLSIVPNLLPLLAAFAAMAILRLPLDAATVMVASIALGIAVDNTAHVLESVRRLRARGLEVADAIRKTLSHVGSAMVVTSVTGAIGFASLCVSRFIPVRDFGLLSVVAIGAALVGDLLLLPATLMVWRWRR
jgi:hypothetical protein